MLTLKNTLQRQLSALSQELLGVTPAVVELEKPADLQHGDLSTNLALTVFRQLSSEQQLQYASPRQLAVELVMALRSKLPPSLVSQVETAGPGFINLTLADRVLLDQLDLVLTGDWAALLQTERHTQDTVIVEYSSPNIAKPFTIGHLRSTIIGDAVANLLAATGWRVFRDNHLGDWGTQFGKQIYAFLHLPLDPSGQRTNEEILDSSAHPVKELVQLYVQFHTLAEQQPELEAAARQWFKKLEDGDSEARRIWQKCIDWSMKEFAQIYDRLGVQFTENDGRGYGESFFEDKMAPVITELQVKNLLQESEGAQLIFLEAEKLPPLMILKKDGATLYATRDLATDRFRFGAVSRYGQAPVIINEVGAEQSEYFQQLFAVERRLGWCQPHQRVHVKHGLYRFQDQKMSTRKGNTIWLNDVLDEAIKRADGSAEIGIGALKWNDLKRSAHLDVVFRWEEVLSMDGNSGPYLQYVYARCQSVLRKAVGEGVRAEGPAATLLASDLTRQDRQLLRQLCYYPTVVDRAAREYAPHHLCTYLFSLAQEFNHFYHQAPILQADTPESVQLRLRLTQAVAITIQHGLQLLGIKTIEKM